MRKAGAAEPNFSRRVLVINTWVCSQGSRPAPRPTDSAGVCFKFMLDIALMQLHDAVSMHVCVLSLSLSCCHGDLALMQNRICLQTWKCLNILLSLFYQEEHYFIERTCTLAQSFSTATPYIF